MYDNTVTFEVHYTGYDNFDYFMEFNDLEQSIEFAHDAIAHGCHCIDIVDSDGNEYPY